MQLLPNGPLSCLKAYDEKEKKKHEVIPEQQQLFVLRAVFIDTLRVEIIILELYFFNNNAVCG